MQRCLLSLKPPVCMINFLLDENIPFELISFLEKKNFVTNHVKKRGKAGIKNGEVYALAESLDAWIITRDNDFGNIFKFNTYNVNGVILLRLTNSTTKNLLQIFKELFGNHPDIFNQKKLIIIDDSEIIIYK